MANANFFIRGGISIGNLYIDETVIYGAGLIEAHYGETKLARDPRIVLTKSAYEVMQKHLKRFGKDKITPLIRRIYRDSDGQFF